MSKNIYDFVLDCSITLAWFFEDEKSDYTDSILEKLKNSKAIVPSIWPLEVANVLHLAKKKKRITELQAVGFIDILSSLPIIIDHTSTSRALNSTFVLASKVDLTIYDAAYLELALREKVPLHTLDKALLHAAKRVGLHKLR